MSTLHGSMPVIVENLPFGIDEYDHVALSNYSGTKPGTIVFSEGSHVVATLTLSYDGSGNVTSIVKA